MRAAIVDREKIVKVWSGVVSVAGAAAGVVVAARVEVAAVVVATMAVVLVSPHTLYRPSPALAHVKKIALFKVEKKKL